MSKNHVSVKKHISKLVDTSVNKIDVLGEGNFKNKSLKTFLQMTNEMFGSELHGILDTM